MQAGRTKGASWSQIKSYAFLTTWSKWGPATCKRHRTIASKKKKKRPLYVKISRCIIKVRGRRDRRVHSFQSHTCFKKFAMLTFLFFMSNTHGCSSIRHGVALRGGSFSRLLLISKVQIRAHKQYVPAFNKVFKVI